MHDTYGKCCGMRFRLTWVSRNLRHLREMLWNDDLDDTMNPATVGEWSAALPLALPVTMQCSIIVTLPEGYEAYN